MKKIIPWILALCILLLLVINVKLIINVNTLNNNLNAQVDLL